MLLYLNSDFIKTQSKKSLQFINNLTLYCHISKKNLEEFKMAEEETAAPASEPINSPAEIAETYVVKERYEIKFDKALPHLNANGALAYQVVDKTNPQRELFALICDNQFPPRLSILPYLKSIDHPNLLKLVEYGIVDYAPRKSHNMALIYKKPAGPRIDSFSGEETPLRNSFERFKSVLLSIVSACESLKDYHLTHRAIRLDNIYYKDSSRNEVVIGDCAASFPSLFQPAAYETIQNTLCIPQGRGNGKASDDIYAAGVVMLSLLLQKELAAELSAPEILRQKLKKGTYLSLLGNERIPNQFSGILKAILNDHEEHRWNYLQIYNHLEGKPNSFAQTESNERSMRALNLNGEKIYTAQHAAIAMHSAPQEALALIKSGKLLEWIKNGLENEKLYNKMEKLLRGDPENKDENPFLVSQACILLDCTLPIKSGELYIFPEGIPKGIFYYLRTEQDLKDFQALLSGDLIKIWYQEQPSSRAHANSSEFKIYVNRKDFGYGIDRIMYDFDDDLPCTSPLLGDEFVNTPAKVLRALDRNYAANKERPPYDRNIIAYLRCKMGKKIDGILTDLNSRQEALQNSAIIRLYANIQNKNGPVQLLNLTLWLINSAKPIIKTYHNLKYQKYLERELIKISKSGKVIELYNILENEEARQKDRSEYSAAVKEISLLLHDRNRIANGGAKLDEEAKELALRFVSVLSILTMVTSFIFSLIHWVIK